MASKKGLTKTQLSQVRADLESRRNWLLSEFRGDASGAAVERGGDEGDQATFALNAELTMNARARESRELKLISEALSKIERGGYGVCDECSDAIPLARLKALPLAENCIDCQERMESEGALAETPGDLHSLD